MILPPKKRQEERERVEESWEWKEVDEGHETTANSEAMLRFLYSFLTVLNKDQGELKELHRVRDINDLLTVTGKLYHWAKRNEVSSDGIIAQVLTDRLEPPDFGKS